MWLRDSLPVEAPSIRVILYGYDTTLTQNESFQTVQDIAISFVSRLVASGRSNISAKPIAFLAHSLGGIVLKHALLEMANSEPRRPLFEMVRAVIFFGVPHKGMEISHLRSMVDGQPNGRIVEDLGPASTYLRVLDDQFSGLARQSVRVFSVFETKRSPTVRVLPIPPLLLLLLTQCSCPPQGFGRGMGQPRFLLPGILLFTSALLHRTSFLLIRIIPIWSSLARETATICVYSNICKTFFLLREMF